jgi:hypothetical protein
MCFLCGLKLKPFKTMKFLVYPIVFFMAMVSFGQSIDPLIQSEYSPKPETAEGHPYLFEEGQSVSLKVSAGLTPGTNFRYNVVDNNLIVTLNSREYVLRKDLITGFVIQGKKKTLEFEPLTIGDKLYFVEALYSDGQIKFVKWYRKHYTKTKAGGSDAYNASTQPIERFEDISKHLVVIDGRINEFPKKKDEVIELIANGNADTKAFLLDTIKKQKLKVTNEEGLVALLKARNEYAKK